MQRKVFWVLFLTLSLIADLTLPILWGFILMIPLVLVSWWVAYRSGIF